MKPDLNYINVMEDVVGEIPLLPDFNTATVSMVADTFNTTATSVYTAHNRLKKAGNFDGERSITAEELLAANWSKDRNGRYLKAGHSVFIPGSGSIKTFTKEGIFSLVHEMPNNEKAKEIRNRIWKLKYRVVEKSDNGAEEKTDIAENPTNTDNGNKASGELQVFSNDTFGKMRIVTIDGEPWFAGKDVAKALGYSDAKSAVRDHVYAEDKQVIQRGQITPIENHLPKSVFPVDFVPADIPNRGLTIINESGLYSLILSSKLPSAKEFKRWVTHDVLPAIRKTGGYIMGEESMSDEELLAKAVLLANAKIAEREKKIAELKQTNKALAEGICEHEPRYVLRRLAHEYGAIVWPWQSRENQIKFAYGKFYREISDAYHIDVHSRYMRGGQVGQKVGYIRKDEWPLVMKAVVALCVDSGINVGMIMNGANKRKYVG